MSICIHSNNIESILDQVNDSNIEEAQSIVHRINQKNPLSVDYKLIHYAALYNKPDIIDIYINQGKGTQDKTKTGDTALSIAMQKNHFDIITKLIKAPDFYPYHTDTLGNTFVHIIAQKSTPKILNILFHHMSGKDINTILDSGNHKNMTPLHMASYNTHDPQKMIHTLISYGSDIRSRSHNGQTPLHTAAMEFNTQAVIQLLREGAPVNITNNDKKMPLDMLLIEGSGNYKQDLIFQIALILISYGADISHIVTSPVIEYMPKDVQDLFKQVYAWDTYITSVSDADTYFKKYSNKQMKTYLKALLKRLISQGKTHLTSTARTLFPEIYQKVISEPRFKAVMNTPTQDKLAQTLQSGALSDITFDFN
jgi:ankyrin repeat protein